MAVHLAANCRYCESIGATLQKEKKGSVFITPTMITILRDLSERIAEYSQSSFTEGKSWFGKKTSRGENFWKALETKLSKFVTGDEIGEDMESVGATKKPVEIQDTRFGRIASDTNLNRMASLPNLRAPATPIYAGASSDTMHASTARSKYAPPATESRYTPAFRAPVQSVEFELGTPVRETPSDVAAFETKEGIYSPFVPLAQPALVATPEPYEPHQEISAPTAEERQDDSPVDNWKEPEKSAEDKDNKPSKRACNFCLTGSSGREIWRRLVWRMV
jgi:hypothetical protein